MENQSLVNGLQWLGGGLVIFLGAIGAGSLILALLNRYWGKRDKVEDIHSSNTGEKIKADVTLVQSMLERIKTLEQNQKEQNDRLMSLTETNAELKTKNEYLDKENSELRQEVRDLRKHRRESDLTIAELRIELDALKTLVQKNGPSSMPSGRSDDPINVKTS